MPTGNDMKAYKCKRCGHVWVARIYTEEEPRVCPKCKNAYWNVPKKLHYDWRKTHRRVIKV